MGKRDIRLIIEDVKFGCRSVGVIKKNNKILFQKRKDDKNWALPGGGIEVLERAKDVVEVAASVGELGSNIDDVAGRVKELEEVEIWRILGGSAPLEE
jgi:8-oxo-dGTP pyrophosphatase MutT (NUDIX family)